MQNPAVVVAVKEGGEFKCDLRVEERPIPQYKDDEVTLLFSLKLLLLLGSSFSVTYTSCDE